MGWIGVDLDGTLAHYEGDVRTIGQPIGPMLARVKQWLAQGKTVKILTARAADPHQVAAIRAWLRSVGLPDLAITDRKDFRMTELWDDRAVSVQTNTGRPKMWLDNAK